jgi:hypothetical protein
MLWKFSFTICVPTPGHDSPVCRIIAPVATLRVFSISIDRPKINRATILELHNYLGLTALPIARRFFFTFTENPAGKKLQLDDNQFH